MANALKMRERAKVARLRAMGIIAPVWEDGKGMKTISAPALNPETARAVLRLPEKEQEILIYKPKTLADEGRQAKIVQALSHEEEGGEDEGHPKAALQEHHGHHETTPAQEKAERQWALIFVTAIVTASVTFETLKEITEENTPETMIKVVEKFFGELATLGFIGTIAFVMTTDFGDSESVLGQLSFTYTGDNHMLVHEFEILHFLIFFVMVFFVSAVLVILQLAIGQRKLWASFQQHLNSVLKDPRTKIEDLHALMVIPDYPAGVEGTVVHEYSKNEEVRRAIFLRLRQQFIADAECVVTIPEDFDFAQYLSWRIAHVLSEVCVSFRLSHIIFYASTFLHR